MHKLPHPAWLTTLQPSGHLVVTGASNNPGQGFHGVGAPIDVDFNSLAVMEL